MQSGRQIKHSLMAIRLAFLVVLTASLTAFPIPVAIAESLRSEEFSALQAESMLLSNAVTNVAVSEGDDPRWALIIGVGDYAGAADLPFSDDSAVAVYYTLLSWGWPAGNIILLLSPFPAAGAAGFQWGDQNPAVPGIQPPAGWPAGLPWPPPFNPAPFGAGPTRANIIAALAWLADNTTEGDKVLIYFSGHGGNQLDGNDPNGNGIEDPGEALPGDIDWGDEPEPLPRHDETIIASNGAVDQAITDDEFTFWLEGIKDPNGDWVIDKHVQIDVILDSCRSGGFAGRNNGAVFRPTGFDARQDIALSPILLDETVVLEACHALYDPPAPHPPGHPAHPPAHNDLSWSSAMANLRDHDGPLGFGFLWPLGFWRTAGYVFDYRVPPFTGFAYFTDWLLDGMNRIVSWWSLTAGRGRTVAADSPVVFPATGNGDGSVSIEEAFSYIRHPNDPAGSRAPGDPPGKVVPNYLAEALDTQYGFMWAWVPTTRLDDYYEFENITGYQHPEMYDGILGNQTLLHKNMRCPVVGLINPPDGANVHKDTTLSARELLNASAVASATFEYSADGLHWIPIGTDTDGTTVEKSHNRTVPGYGVWYTNWSIAGLSEGYYYVRVNMTSAYGTWGLDQVQVYVDPTPPIPHIYEPSFGATVSGDVAFRATTTDENVVSMTLEYLAIGLPPYEKGVPLKNQHDYGPLAGAVPSTADYSNNDYCGPTSAASSLVYLAQHGFPELLLDEEGNPITQEEFVEWLGGAAEVNENQPSQPDAGGVNDDKLVDAIRQWINNHGGGLTVELVSKDDFTFEKYKTELEQSEDVLVSTPYHWMVGNSVSNTKNADGTYDVDFMDPWTGTINQTKMRPNGEFEWPPESGKWTKDTMIVISPDPELFPEWPGWLRIGTDSNGADGWSVAWDTTKVPPNQYYIIRAKMTDANGETKHSKTVVYVVPKPVEKPVGGFATTIATGDFGSLIPYVGLASTMIVATAAAAIYVKRVKRRKKKQ